MAGPGRPLLGGAAAAVTASATLALALRHPAVPGSRWARTNHAGAPVTLLEGPAAVAAVLAGVMVPAHGSRHETAALAVAVLGSGLVGGYDDLHGSSQARGFRGHLRALREGRLTTGMIKIVGIGVAGVMSAGLLATDPAPGSRRSADRVLDLALDSTLIAGTANLVNLLDLRPGRAAKAVGLLALALAVARPRTAGLGPLLGAVAGVLPADLQGRAMLGDCGANALGAGLATAAAAVLPRPARVLALTLVLVLNAASERVSFTAVIEQTGWLRRLDALGRPRVP
jgi:UDP-GlcNAc:undecaprenyl-phosphate GlcNAc-1-phosphate transferase